MPSTRATGDAMDGLDNDYSDDEYDPDYRESSEGESDDDVPKTMHRDRARWVEDNVEDVEHLYRHLLESGRSVMGDVFL